MFYLDSVTYENDKPIYHIIDTDDNVDTPCSKEELEGYLQRGVNILGVNFIYDRVEFTHIYVIITDDSNYYQYDGFLLEPIDYDVLTEYKSKLTVQYVFWNSTLKFFTFDKLQKLLRFNNSKYHTQALDQSKGIELVINDINLLDKTVVFTDCGELIEYTVTDYLYAYIYEDKYCPSIELTWDYIKVNGHIFTVEDALFTLADTAKINSMSEISFSEDSDLVINGMRATQKDLFDLFSENESYRLSGFNIPIYFYRDYELDDSYGFDVPFSEDESGNGYVTPDFVKYGKLLNMDDSVMKATFERGVLSYNDAISYLSAFSSEFDDKTFIKLLRAKSLFINGKENIGDLNSQFYRGGWDLRKNDYGTQINIDYSSGVSQLTYNTQFGMLAIQKHNLNYNKRLFIARFTHCGCLSYDLDSFSFIFDNKVNDASSRCFSDKVIKQMISYDYNNGVHYYNMNIIGLGIKNIFVNSVGVCVNVLCLINSRDKDIVKSGQDGFGTYDFGIITLPVVLTAFPSIQSNGMRIYQMPLGDLYMEDSVYDNLMACHLHSNVNGETIVMRDTLSMMGINRNKKEREYFKRYISNNIKLFFKGR